MRILPEARTNDALPEKVGLRLRRRATGEFPVNLILNVAHRNERGHDTTPFAGFH